MSILDGLGQSFFCRKVEKTRPMREEMDRKVFVSRQGRHFSLVFCSLPKYFSVFVSQLGMRTIMIPGKEEVQIEKMKVSKTKLLLLKLR